MTKTIACLDVEATGLDTQHDRVITLAIVKLENLGDRAGVPFFYKVNPGIPIPPEATEIHGLKDADVAHSPPFSDLAEPIHLMLKDCDLLGFNLWNFDIPILWEEFRRAGIEWDFTPAHVIDAGAIFKLREPRDLTAAVKFYSGHAHGTAHNAMADTLATLNVFADQMLRYDDLPVDADALHKLCLEDRRGNVRMDLAGTVIRDQAGTYRYTHKKVRGVAVKDDAGYAAWMLRNDFPAQTKQVLRGILAELFPPDQDELPGWQVERGISEHPVGTTSTAAEAFR